MSVPALRFQPKEPSVASAFVHRQPYLFWAARAPGGTCRARSRAEPDSPQPSYLGHPALGEPVRGNRRRYAVLPGQGQDPLRGGENLVGLGPGALETETFKLVGDLDHAAGVDDVVGRVHDAVIGEQFVHARMSQLVVG